MTAPPPGILQAWKLEGTPVHEIGGGHINLTFRIDADHGPLCLQRLNPIFDPRLHEDIHAITEHLHAEGLATPRLRSSVAGRLWEEDEEGQAWRVMDWMEGQVIMQADGPARCKEAGRLLGRFHAALWDLEHRWAARRLGVHDTLAHLAKLEKALGDGGEHPLDASIRPVAEDTLKLARGLDLPGELPERMVHGDPKIANLLFFEDGRAHCWVDLDTLAPMPLAVELGDAMRSWCSPAGEETESRFELDHFQAGLSGWLEGVAGKPTREEISAILPWCEGIAVELAARFCADAYEESYFGWDAKRFSSAAEHNLLRARSQLALARSMAQQRPQMEHILRELLSA